MDGGAANAAGKTELVQSLLDWYDRHRRRLPWRVETEARPDPYKVWLSEIMLQQTTVAAVGPYFARFLERWPTVGDLAGADLDEVLHAWQGLGYYARARNLHRCARVVAADYGGRFPDTEAELLRLPGIGAYTAAAIAAIAFDRQAAVMDGNIERVVARLFAVGEPLPSAKPRLRRMVAGITPAVRPGDFAQAMMDLGATICTPRRPRCIACPVAYTCRARTRGIAEELPRRAPKAERPTRRGIAFWVERPDGAILLRRRNENGLLGGMMEIPSTDWVEGGAPDPLAAAPVQAEWRPLSGKVRHTFTHFHLELEVLAGKVETRVAAPEGSRWVGVDRLGDHALPTVMKKVVRFAAAKL